MRTKVVIYLLYWRKHGLVNFFFCTWIISYTCAAQVNAIKLHSNNCALFGQRAITYNNTQKRKGKKNYPGLVFTLQAHFGGGLAVRHCFLFSFCERALETCGLCVCMPCTFNKQITETIKLEPWHAFSFSLLHFFKTNKPKLLVRVESHLQASGAAIAWNWLNNWNCSWLWRHAGFGDNDIKGTFVAYLPFLKWQPAYTF